MKCPVCDNVNTSLVCLRCGFDGSTNYEKYPTFGAVGKVPTVSALREQWRENPPPPKKKKPWLAIAVCAAIFALGIGIGTGMGKAEPAEPIESIQMQGPVETTTAPAGTVVTTEDSKPTEPEETEAAVLTLDPNDVSLFRVNESFTIYPRLGSSSVSRSKVTWTTSDPKIATVDNGVVTAVGKGEATITAEHEGKKATCIVRCRFENPTNQGTQDGQENPSPQTWEASYSDVSISVGEPFRLTVKNSDGKTADAIWTASIDGIVTVDGKVVTGCAPGVVTLTTTVEGQTVTCIVRVK